MTVTLLLATLFFSSSLHAQLQTTPTRKVTETVEFDDDLNLENLELALDRQIASFERQTLSGQIRYGTRVYPRSILKTSAEEMRRIVRETRSCLSSLALSERCWSNFNGMVRERFDLYAPVPAASEPGHGTRQPTFYTAYYSPDFEGSRTPSERFSLPIYRLPPTDALRTLSREAIDFDGALLGRGLELFWVDGSRFDLYGLHIEGGGRVRLTNDDGSEEFRYLSYAGKNGQGGEFISRYMLGRGYISNTSMENQEEFLANNPQLHREIFSTYRAYIFFAETDDEPYGVQNIPLTEGRSMAIDTRIYKHVGVISFVKAQKAVVQADGSSQQVPFSRFFVTQDTGGAIRGNARADLYMGFGQAAKHIAHNMKTQGVQYFLIKK